MENLHKKLVRLLIKAGVTMFPTQVASALIQEGVTIKQTGRWIKRTDCSEPECEVCGRCPKLVFGILPDFCPHCGAIMQGGEPCVIKKIRNNN